MPRSLTLIAAGAVAVLALSGCGPDEPKPNYSSVSAPPTSSTSTPSTSDSPTGVPSTGPNVSPGEVAPTEPAEAGQDSQEGALAFAAYYFKMLDWSYAVNSSDLMTPLFSTSCDNCTKLTENLAATFKLGVVTGTRVSIEQVALVANDGRGGAQFAVSGIVQISGGALASGGSSAPIPAEPDTTITLWLVYKSDRFQVVSQAKV